MIKKNNKIMLVLFAALSSALMLVAKSEQVQEVIKKDLEQSFSVTVEQKQKQFSTIKCLLLCVDKSKNIWVTQVAQDLKYDLEFTDQLAIEMKRSDKMLDTKVTQKLFKQGTSLCLYLQPVYEKKNKKNQLTIQVQLIDTSSQASLFDKKYTVAEKTRVFDTHQISADLIPVLTGTEGVTMSSLAFCKQLSPKHKVVCVTDYACFQEKIIVSSPSLNVAPCWHSKEPLIFYSHFTKTNCRLMSVDFFSGRHSIICSYDGLTMLPSFSKDGKQVVLCMSGRGGNSELYLYDQRLCHKLQKRVYVPLTANGASNVSPCLLSDGNVIFCSDFETNYPQIYYLNKQTKEVFRITNGKGHCAAPSYNEKNNAVVYIRLVKGVFQLFSCSLEKGSRSEKQLTFDCRDKLDPTWSPCGRYAAFTLECIDEKRGKKIPQIAVLNCASGKIRILTHSKEPKSFAAWVNAPYFAGEKGIKRS